MSDPKLSIIIPCYNYARYLRTSVDSVLRQDYLDYELLLVDDGSTDETWAIMNAYASRHAHVRIFRHERNLGLFQANQKGWEEARGEYLHFFSADDLYHEKCLKHVMKFFKEHSQIGLVCTDLAYIKENGEKSSRQKLLSEQKEARYYTPQEAMILFQTTSFWIPGLCCVVKANILKKHGHLDPKLENISDWFCFHKIALFEGIGYIPKTLISMRLHDQTYTSQVKKDKKRRRATYYHLLQILTHNRELRVRFKQSGLLTFIWQELRWKLRLNPRYWRCL